MLSEKEGDGELGGRVMELMRLGPLSILRGQEATAEENVKRQDFQWTGNKL